MRLASTIFNDVGTNLLNDTIPPSNPDSGAHYLPGNLYDAGVVINRSGIRYVPWLR